MKLLHAADFHLDSPFAGLDPDLAAQRRRELRELPGRLADLARREGAELLLLPGDLFDGGRVYPESVTALKEALGSLDIPVFVSPGNHDYHHPRSPYATRWPDNVHIFKESAWESVLLSGCTVHGWGFTSPHWEQPPLASFTPPESSGIHILCLHGEVGVSSRYGPIPPPQLAASKVTYAALGHIHTCTGLQREGDTWWAYPGCPEGRGFDELGDKGALLVELDRKDATARFIPLCSRRHRVEVLRPGEQPPAVDSPDLVRYLLRGECKKPPNVPAITAALATRHFYVEVRDETTLPQQLWAREREDSLTGLFLRRMRQAVEEAAPEERETLILATRFGLAALEGGEDIRP